LAGGGFMQAVVETIFFPFNNVTCIANGEDVTTQIAIMVLGTTAIASATIGCLAVQIISFCKKTNAAPQDIIIRCSETCDAIIAK
jgi:hypothetical protein